MAVDMKYGKVTLEHGSIGEDEPVVVFRARDRLLPELLHTYDALCRLSNVPDRHLNMLAQVYHRITSWQSENQTQLPSNEESREWLEGKTPEPKKPKTRAEVMDGDRIYVRRLPEPDPAYQVTEDNIEQLADIVSGVVTAKTVGREDERQLFIAMPNKDLTGRDDDIFYRMSHFPIGSWFVRTHDGWEGMSAERFHDNYERAAVTYG